MCLVTSGVGSDENYSDVIMTIMSSQITSLAVVYSIFYSDADQRNQSSVSLAFVRGIHRWPVNSPHKGPVTRKMFPFDDVIVSSAWGLTIDSTIPQISQCIWQICYGAPFCNRNMHTYIHIPLTKWCIVGYGTGALPDLCSSSLVTLRTLWLW